MLVYNDNGFLQTLCVTPVSKVVESRGILEWNSLEFVKGFGCPTQKQQ